MFTKYKINVVYLHAETILFISEKEEYWTYNL